jgi:CrcB protein
VVPETPFPSRSRLRRVRGVDPFKRSATLAVGLGGGIGALARYEIAIHAGIVTPPGVPSVTLWINVSGAFLLGLLVTLVIEHWPPTRYVRPFVGIGILGGFTTFSTFVVETDRLIGAGFPGRAAAYAGVSLLLGLVAMTLGTFAARAWPLVRGVRSSKDEG